MNAVDRLDTTPPVPHARRRVTLFRRVAAVVAVLALCAGNAAVCAGWQPTPEERMACCATGTSCPMHTSGGHQHASSTGAGQATADRCCAASTERRDSGAAGSVFASSGAIALLPAVLVPVSPMLPDAGEWAAPVPLRASPVPRHLLLSVFLL